MFKYDHTKGPLENGMKLFEKMRVVLNGSRIEFSGVLVSGSPWREYQTEFFIWAKESDSYRIRTNLKEDEEKTFACPNWWEEINDVLSWKFVNEELNKELEEKLRKEREEREGWKAYDSSKSLKENGMKWYFDYEIIVKRSSMLEIHKCKLCKGAPNETHRYYDHFVWISESGKYISGTKQNGFPNPREWASFHDIVKFREVK